MKKIKVEVFGTREVIPSAGGCGCSSSQTMDEMYDEFLNRIKVNELYEHIELKWIDYSSDLVGYDHAKKAYEKGYNLPLIAIDGRVRFHSSIPFNQIVKLIKQQVK